MCRIFTKGLVEVIDVAIHDRERVVLNWKLEVSSRILQVK
jgi:hypothetical protein